MIFLLDTTTFSDLMQEDPRAVAKLVGVAPTDRVAICSIVRGEVRHGIERLPSGKRREVLEAKALRLLAAILCEPVLPAAGDHYGRIKATAQNKGLSLDENDLWIAAVTLSLGAILVSRDTDFERVEGLSVVNWRE